MPEGLGVVANVQISFAQAEMRRAIGERNPLPLEQRLHAANQRIARRGAPQLGLSEQDTGRIRQLVAASSSASNAWPWRPNSANSAARLAIASWRPGPGTQTPDRRLQAPARIRSSPAGPDPARCKPPGSPAPRLSPVSRRGERLFEPIEIFQHEGAGGESAGMARREGEQRVERSQGPGAAAARRLDCREIYIGVGQLAVEFERAPRHRFRAIVIAFVDEEVGKIAVSLGVGGLERDRREPALLRFAREPETLEGVGEIVERPRVRRLEAQRLFERDAALVELQGFL